MSYQAIAAAAAAIRAATGAGPHRVGAVLGSGLGVVATELPGAKAIPYADIPGFPTPSVAGHQGTLYSVELDGVGVLLLSGRVHAYEGRSLEEVVFAVRAIRLAGCESVLLTNSAGGCGKGLRPGDLVLIRDHLNLTARNPLAGPNDERLGPRFPDMSRIYAPQLREMAHRVAAEVGVPLRDGVYSWFLGPSYETPAEVRMARLLGADLVGMSTVPEAIALRHMGARVVAISLVTNLAAGISDSPLSHDDVTATAQASREVFSRLLLTLLPLMA